jgi:hypothetical protein
MKKHLNKRRVVLAAFVAVVLAIASGVAYAYWTAGGAGTGAGTAAVSTSNLTVNQTTVLTPMYPGDVAQTLAGTFNNPNTGPVYVTTVTASISSVAMATGHSSGTCDATDFTLTPTATVNAEIPTGNSKGAWTGPTIKFNDKVTGQDYCKGATVNLAYSIP